MKAKFFCAILFAALLVSLFGTALPTTPVIAAGVGQQFWYITNTLSLALNPSTETGSSVIAPVQFMGTSDSAVADITIEAGYWTGYIALNSPYTGGSNIKICYGPEGDPGSFGTSTLTPGTYQNGFGLSFETSRVTIPAGNKVYLKFETGTPNILTGGTYSYVCSPPGSQAFPDPTLSTFGLTMSSSGNGTTSPVVSVTPYDYFDGTVVPISATAQTGNHFTAWSGSVTGTTNPTTVTMDTNNSVTANFAANEKTSTTTVVASTSPISTSGQSVTFTATVTPGSGSATPTGSLVFKDGVSTLSAGNSIGSGQWAYSTSALSVGAHDITAEYAGDSSFAASVSDIFIQRVVTGLVNLVLTTTATTIVVDEDFNVVVEAHCGSQTVVGIAAYLNFDSTKLEVVDMDVANGIQITGGTTLTAAVQNSVNNTSGQINFSAGVMGTTYPSGNFTVATIRFHTLAATSADTAVSFQQQTPDKPMSVGTVRALRSQALPPVQHTPSCRKQILKFRWDCRELIDLIAPGVSL